MNYDPYERGHRRGKCHFCGYQGWSDDAGNCPMCTIHEEDLTDNDEGGEA